MSTAEQVAAMLVETDAMTPQDPETLRPETYIVYAENMTYLVQTVLNLAAVPSPVPAGTEREALAQRRLDVACEVMHDAYEAAAVGAGWETQAASRRPWADVPDANKVTMRVAVRALMAHLAAVVSSSPATPARHPGDEGNPAIDALKASSARIATAPPASPAETREGRAALDDARLEVLAVEMRETASHAESSGQPVGPGELRAFARIIDKVRDASPAVSLDDQPEDWYDARCGGCPTCDGDATAPALPVGRADEEEQT